MLQNFLKAWQNNRGNLLLVLGAVAGIMMCLVWYFKLVPKVRFVSRNVSGAIISTSLRQTLCPLVATVRLVAQPPAEEETPVVDLKAMVELHIPNDILQPGQAPLFSRELTIRNDGVAKAVVFHDIQPGTYAVLVYLDLNDNQKFDFDVELLKPLEPYRLSRGPVRVDHPGDPADPADPAAKPVVDAVPKPFDLVRAGIEVTTDQTTLVEFDFRQARK